MDGEKPEGRERFTGETEETGHLVIPSELKQVIILILTRDWWIQVWSRVEKSSSIFSEGAIFSALDSGVNVWAPLYHVPLQHGFLRQDTLET